MLNLNNSIGAILVGAFVTMYLFGIVTVQTYQYYRKYPGDSLWLNGLVAFVWALLLGHSIAVAIGVYTISVLKFGQLSSETLTTFPLPLGLASSILFSAFIAPVSQGFFAYRIHVISRRGYIPALFWAVSFVRLVGGMGLGAYVIKNNDSVQHVLAKFAWIIEAAVVSGAACDTMIALTMCYYLKRERSIALTRTAQILNRLMKYTIETGALTRCLILKPNVRFADVRLSLAGLAILIFYLTTVNLTWFGVYLLLAEVYRNALLANLNARKPHPIDDKEDYGLRRLTFLANIQARNSNLQRGLAHELPYSSKDGTGPATPEYARDGVPLTPSTPTVQGIVIEVCQTKQVARDADGASEEPVHSVEPYA
ncbi:hypothetical protein BJ138DRAFT_533857 [Hygrophoropsis aurantiaca]|uniref:Uncharacterized protein n=1 Tax=Hygrophoropsis aurantiaca TaxID=72124 RepID=A0ACB8A1B5_9AGAM|nr:hypothetical protein BJ138DRAFT_533857 [Hygrophoropsis aurantiaca]